jgi:hypothetical protein
MEKILRNDNFHLWRDVLEIAGIAGNDAARRISARESGVQ